MELFKYKLVIQHVIIPIFKIMDLFIIKNNNYWGFPLHYIKTTQFIENPRAVFESVKENPEIVKIIFYREIFQSSLKETTHVKFVKLNSFSGLYYLAKCRVLFVANAISFDYTIRFKNAFVAIKLNNKKRIIVNLWHGIPIKKQFELANSEVRNRTLREKYRIKERMYYNGLIASSKIDSYAMSTTFNPIKYKNIWITGLPRNDFLKSKKNDLPQYIKKEVDYIQSIKGTKNLVVYAPTYRENIEASYYHFFTENEILELKSTLKRNNAILGVRLHYFKNSTSNFNIEDYIDNEIIFDFGHEKISEFSALARETNFLITDYSSVFIESLYLNCPVFCFAYDLDVYEQFINGLLYDLDVVFPGPVRQNFTDIIKDVEKEMITPTQVQSEKFTIAKKIFFEYNDNNNSKRVVEKIKSELTKFE